MTNYPPILAFHLLSLALLTGESFAAPASSPEAPPTSAEERLTIRSQLLLERDVRLLTEVAAKHLDSLLGPLFEDYHARVGDFATWAFQWRTGYALLRRGVFAVATAPFSDPPFADHVSSAWNDLIAAKFEELVLRPAGGTAALHSVRNRWLIYLNPVMDAVMTDTLLTASLLRGREPPSREIWNRGDALSPFRDEDEAPLLEAVGTASNPVKARMVRPLFTRFTIRPQIAAAVAATGQNIGTLGGLSDLGIIGSVASLATTIGAFLSIDYMISRADATLHQDDLEAEIHRVLENEHAALRESWLATIQTEIDRRVAVARLLLDEPSSIKGENPEPIAPGKDRRIPD